MNTQDQVNYLFENDFAFVTSEGEVKLKENKLFEERVIATVDPEAFESEIEALERAFAELEDSFTTLFGSIDNSTSEEVQEAISKAEKLIEDAKSVPAIGDFESLLTSIDSRLDELRSKMVQPVPLTNESAIQDALDEEAGSVLEEDEGTSDHDPLNTERKEDTDTPSAAVNQTEGDANEASANEEITDSESKVTDLEETEDSDEANQDEADELDNAEGYYQKLAEKAVTLSEISDWAYATMEFENIELQWKEGPETEGMNLAPYREQIDNLRQELDDKKRAHYEEQKRIREQNLEKKKDLLRQMKQIIDDGKWSLTREVSKIKNRWEQIRLLPAGEQDKLDSSFKELLQTFEDHKVDRLVKQKQQEEDNLTIKLVILEKMEKFLETVDEKSDWVELDKKLAEYVRQFRKIGRIPSEKNQETWNRFHDAQDEFHKMRFKFDKKYRSDVEKYLSKKKKLIDEAEALIDAEDLPDASRKVNKLHRLWKKTGNLPQKDENEMWDRFKAATDAFNEKKSENLDQLREQEDENYDKKVALVLQAEKLKESEEWEDTHREFQRLMDKWKVTGPVPRRKSGKIWKKFKGAMDDFYNRRREFFKEAKEERKDNLKEKESVLEQLKELMSHENPIEAVELAKPLQTEFKKSGYVPIKHKNRLWKEYREVCDTIYERFRATKSAAHIVGKENIEHFSTDDLQDIKRKQDQADKLRKEIGKMSSELIQMKESLSYFKPSGKGSSLLDDVRNRIDNAEKNLNNKEEKLQKLEVEIDKLKRDV